MSWQTQAFPCCPTLCSYFPAVLPLQLHAFATQTCDFLFFFLPPPSWRPEQQCGTVSVLVWHYTDCAHTLKSAIHTVANGTRHTLQADAASATLSDVVCACRVYVGMSACMCLSGSAEGRAGVWCVHELKEGTMQCQSP